jgi:uncharacterized protein (TIGR03435 family)
MRRSVFVYATALSVAVVTVAVNGPGLHAQATSPTFDVVSVKRNRTAGGGMMRAVPGNLTAIGVQVRQLIRQAFGVQDFQILEAPDWVSNDRFDIEARFDAAAPGPAGPARMQAMLKSLLADRFRLRARSETREMPILALVIARADGRLGPQLKPATVDCVALAGRGGPPDGRGGPPPDGRGALPDGRRGGGPGPEGRGAPPPPGTPFTLGPRPQCGGRGGFGQLIAGGLPMSQFATQLSQLTGRIVVDRTGLTGGYDLDLKWTPTPDQLPPGPPPPGFEPPPIDPNGPSLSTALEEQLGLKLDSQRGPVDVLVIEGIEPPTEN